MYLTVKFDNDTYELKDDLKCTLFHSILDDLEPQNSQPQDNTITLDPSHRIIFLHIFNNTLDFNDYYDVSDTTNIKSYVISVLIFGSKDCLNSYIKELFNLMFHFK